ncbi:Hint domain-containing protein [Amylibacter sp. SFDW26]|uniref:Hint domain-containing protein n=1 Tax=Amylibacter sp. SFDW26 TaxID=2652722 RepID=UPI00126259C3|nr:Hint domain-containing protein [Amylibacter sp. SFDW26]KAB7615554.1 Hint domain-containing protein [Amylibacter sp. SFDW26]
MVAPLSSKTAFQNATMVPSRFPTRYPSENVQNTNHSGFAADTNIMTSFGDVRVQNLEAGARVITRDHGMQSVRWIGSYKARIRPENAPIVIQKSVLKNTRDLILSPEHRILFKGEQAELMFGQPEVLIPARAFLNNDRVYQVIDGIVEYYHVLFDRHEIIYSEGTSTESYHPNEVNMAAFDQETRESLYQAFPNLQSNPKSFGPSIRTCLNAEEACLLEI